MLARMVLQAWEERDSTRPVSKGNRLRQRGEAWRGTGSSEADSIPAGTFHGGDTIPAGTFHSADAILTQALTNRGCTSRPAQRSYSRSIHPLHGRRGVEPELATCSSTSAGGRVLCGWLSAPAREPAPSPPVHTQPGLLRGLLVRERGAVQGEQHDELGLVERALCLLHERAQGLTMGCGSS